MKRNTSKQYNGMYVGICIQNNDPEKRGRVKVFIPHITPAPYKTWDEDKKFKFPGLNINSDLSHIIDDLRVILPWAECAAPILGESASGRYNESQKSASTSDSPIKSTTTSNIAESKVDYNLITKYSQNYDSVGEKLGNKYDIDHFRLKDAFADPAETNANNVNKHSFNYIPETFSNQAKGSFSIPNVGAHLWVFFNAGDPHKPVYFACSQGSDEWRGIYEFNDSNGVDYPSDYENRALSGSAISLNTEMYRNKFVLNQKGGTIQIVNTDNRETLKLTHFSGSFKEFNTQSTIELATANDQKLVIGDQFQTVRGHKNSFVERDFDLIVKGTVYQKIGNLRVDCVKQWKDIIAEVNNIKQLFDIKRATALTRDVFNLTSTLQSRTGSFAACPVCRGSEEYYYRLNNTAATVGLTVNTSEGGGPFTGESVPDKNLIGPNALGQFVKSVSTGKVMGITCPSCGGAGLSRSSMNGIWEPERLKDSIGKMYEQKLAELTNLEKQMGLGGSLVVDVTKHKIETIGLVMNDFNSIRVDAVGKMFYSDLVIGTEGVLENRTPTPLVEYVQVDDLPGGNYTLNVCNRFNTLVGAGGIHLKSFGPVDISGSITNIAGEQVNIGSENEINISGGKRLTLTADVISIRQKDRKQVLVDSSLGVGYNLIVGGGVHVEGELTVSHITAPTELQATEDTVVYGTTTKRGPQGQGKIIGYAASIPGRIVGYIEVGMFTGIVTTGSEAGAQVTNTARVPIMGSGVGQNGPPGSKSTCPIELYGTDSDKDCFVMEPHGHIFKNIPLTLTGSHDDMRKRAALNNDLPRNIADPINNSKK